MTRSWLFSVVSVLAVSATACWTGPVAEPAPTEPPTAPVDRRTVDLEIKLTQTPCFGRCPVFEITVQHDGTLRYFGRDNVAQKGEHTKKLTPAQMVELARIVERVHFFTLDDQGREPATEVCTHVGKTMTCSFRSDTICSDTSHSVVTVRRPKRGGSHTVDDAHCTEVGAVTPLEEKIQAHAATWITR